MSKAVDMLATDTARVVTHLHPVLVLSAYYLRFPALVANPISALLTSLLPLAIIQSAYAVVCLPAAGSTLRGSKKEKKNKSAPAPKKTCERPSAYVVVSRICAPPQHLHDAGLTRMQADNTVARPHLPLRLPSPRHPDPAGCAPDDASPPHNPQFRAYRSPSRLSPRLRPRRQQRRMEGDPLGSRATRRGVWCDGRLCAGRVVGRRANPAGLG